MAKCDSFQMMQTTIRRVGHNCILAGEIKHGFTCSQRPRMNHEFAVWLEIVLPMPNIDYVYQVEFQVKL